MLNDKKKTQAFHMPWEQEYGYAQAVRHKNTVWISGQLGHDESGALRSGMEPQMEQAYANIGKLLKGFDMKPDDVVEEVIYVTDMASAFHARKKCGYDFYPDPKRIASTIVVVGGLALPGQLVEIKIVARK